jgi:hypothetical protein
MRLRRVVPLTLAAIALAACSSDLPTTPGLTSAEDSALMTAHEGPFEVGICKTWLGGDPVPAIDWEFQWTATAAPTAGTTTIFPSDFGGLTGCINLGSWPAGTEVTVTEVVPDGYSLELIVLVARDPNAAGLTIEDPQTPTYTFLVDTYRTIYFKNDGMDIPPPPPGGGEGCTPGFWRQSQHFQYWTGFAPSDLFANVFGVNRAGTLLQNVTARGGGADALARHAVAALLNAASAEVDYNLSIAEIIAGVQAAYASGNFESFKDVLEGFNEQGCSVDKSR